MGAAKRTDISSKTRLHHLAHRRHANLNPWASAPTRVLVGGHSHSLAASSIATSAESAEPTSKHVQALLQGLVAVEVAALEQNDRRGGSRPSMPRPVARVSTAASPGTTTSAHRTTTSIGAPPPTPSRLVASTQLLLARLSRHRTRPHDYSACPGCRGIRRTVASSSTYMASALRRGDTRTAGIFQRVVGHLEEAWAGRLPGVFENGNRAHEAGV